ncbi:MAG TPA: type II toxin-antitoxin system VapC family toxin [Solirubrobacteraceae bacterium]|nr:type II toxin-antitoxin system VapC family toxin [Solirubrobacteraceae bacterium]
MILLDTNVLSELIRPAPDTGVTQWLDSLDATAVATTAITAAELLHGVARMPRGRRRKRLAEAIRGLLEEDLDGRVEPFDGTAANHYADLVSRREAAGRPISIADAQIAAICRKFGATLATRNTSDFEDTGVDLLDPWQL